MQSWKKVWRDGFLPSIPTEGLEALKKGLEEDDPRLVQGATTQPPPLMCVADWPVEAADPIGFAYFVGVRQGSATVGETESFFAATCYEADQRLGEPTACRHFLWYIDDTPREEMRRELLNEIERALQVRANQDCAAYPGGSCLGFAGGFSPGNEEEVVPEQTGQEHELRAVEHENRRRLEEDIAP